MLETKSGTAFAAPVVPQSCDLNKSPRFGKKFISGALMLPQPDKDMATTTSETDAIAGRDEKFNKTCSPTDT